MSPWIRWEQLPKELEQAIQKDIEFARTAIKLYWQPHQVLAAVPFLREELQVWQQIIELPNFKAFDPERGPRAGKLIRDFAPFHIRSDRELMIKACKSNPGYFRAVGLSLVTDGDFLEELLLFEPDFYVSAFYPLVTLFASVNDHVTRQLLLENMKRCFRSCVLVGDHKKNSCHSSFWMSYCLSKNNLWAQRDVVVAWFETGLPFVHGHHPRSLKYDTGVFLLIAEYCSIRDKQLSFLHSSPALRSDKEFMMKVLMKDPSLLSCATMELRKDFDLAIFAFASSPETVKTFVNERWQVQYYGEQYVRELQWLLQ